MEEKIKSIKNTLRSNKGILLSELLSILSAFIVMIVWMILNKPLSFRLFYEVYFIAALISMLITRKRTIYHYWLAIVFLLLSMLSTMLGWVRIANDFSALVLLFITLGFINHLVAPGKSK